MTVQHQRQPGSRYLWEGAAHPFPSRHDAIESAALTEDQFRSRLPVNRALVRTVRERAGERCEYCRIPQFALPLPFQMDHIMAEQHEGESVPENLALACPHCNRYNRISPVATRIPGMWSGCFIRGETFGAITFNLRGPCSGTRCTSILPWSSFKRNGTPSNPRTFRAHQSSGAACVRSA